MFGRILVPLDGSPSAERSIPVAGEMAKRFGVGVTLLRVVALGMKSAGRAEALSPTARGYLKHAMETLEPVEEAEHVGEVVVTRGSVAAEIVRRAGSTGAGLIVMTPTGGGAAKRPLLGSTADRVLRSSPIPVLIVPSPAGDEGRARPAGGRFSIRSIVVPTDGTSFSETVERPATAMANAFGARVTLLQVVEPLGVRQLVSRGHLPKGLAGSRLRDEIERIGARQLENARFYLEVEANRLRRTEGLRVEAEAIVGENAARSILARSRVLDADLIAIATHARTDLGKFFVGSVADKIIRASDVPVLAIRPRKAKKRARSGE